MSILLVEDSERIRRLVRAILAALPAPIVEAASAEEALTLAEADSHRFELLITDLSMPGLNGIELARRLRERFPSLGVLCMSGHSPPAGPPGDIHFIQKPFLPDELLGKVRELLRAR